MKNIDEEQLKSNYFCKFDSIYIYLETCEELLRVKVNYEDGRRVNQRGKGGLIRLRISKDNHISAIRSRSRGLV